MSNTSDATPTPTLNTRPSSSTTPILSSHHYHLAPYSPTEKDKDDEMHRELVKIMDKDQEMKIVRRFDELNFLQIVMLQGDILQLKAQLEATCTHNSADLSTQVRWEIKEMHQGMRDKLSEYSTSSLQTCPQIPWTH